MNIITVFFLEPSVDMVNGSALLSIKKMGNAFMKNNRIEERWIDVITSDILTKCTDVGAVIIQIDDIENSNDNRFGRVYLEKIKRRLKQVDYEDDLYDRLFLESN